MSKRNLAVFGFFGGFKRELNSHLLKKGIIMKHKRKNEIKLGKNEEFTEDIYPNNGKCPECGGILVTNFGSGISCTFCVDCDYNDYDYD